MLFLSVMNSIMLVTPCNKLVPDLYYNFSFMFLAFSGKYLEIIKI